MDDQKFLERIYRYAEHVKGRLLTDGERSQIVVEFNAAKGDAYTRAREAVRKALGLEHLVEEIRKSASLDNTDRLLLDLQTAAAQWQAVKK